MQAFETQIFPMKENVNICYHLMASEEQIIAVALRGYSKYGEKQYE